MADDENKPRVNEGPARSRRARDWASAQDQLKGKEIFLAKLKDDADQQDACHSNFEHAKKMFADWAAFYIEGESQPPPGLDPYDPASGITPIPKGTEFRFYRTGNDSDRKEREKTVVLIMDPKKEEDLKDVREWRCTYTPYEQR